MVIHILHMFLSRLYGSHKKNELCSVYYLQRGPDIFWYYWLLEIWKSNIWGIYIIVRTLKVKYIQFICIYDLKRARRKTKLQSFVKKKNHSTNRREFYFCHKVIIWKYKILLIIARQVLGHKLKWSWPSALFGGRQEHSMHHFYIHANAFRTYGKESKEKDRHRMFQ